MHELTQALARLACRELVEHSVRCLDSGDIDAFCRLFTDGAVLVRPSDASLNGREAIRASYAARPASRITRHLLTNVAVELLPGERARVRSYVLLYSGSTDSPATEWGRPAEARQLVGEFDDHLERMPDGCWRIARRQARFVLHT